MITTHLERPANCRSQGRSIIYYIRYLITTYICIYRENVGCANSNRLTCNNSIIFNISNYSVQLHYRTSKAIRGISMLLRLIIMNFANVAKDIT